MAIKTIVVPAINLALLFVLTVTKILPVSQVAMATILIMMATPTAAVQLLMLLGLIVKL